MANQSKCIPVRENENLDERIKNLDDRITVIKNKLDAMKSNPMHANKLNPMNESELTAIKDQVELINFMLKDRQTNCVRIKKRKIQEKKTIYCSK